MKHIHIQLMLLCCLVFGKFMPTVYAAPLDLTFHQARERMLISNDGLKASAHEVARSEELEKAARGMYLPQIRLDSRRTRIADDITVDLNDIRQIMGTLHGIPASMLPSFEMPVRNASFTNADINFSWPVYTGGRITAANRAADAAIRESHANQQTIQANLTTQLAERYYGYLFCEAAVRVYGQVLDGIGRHLDQAVKLEENGILAPVERISAQAAYAEALRAVKKAQRSSRTAQAGLRSILSCNEVVRPVSPLFLTRRIEPLQAFLDSAGRNNHQLEKLAAVKEQTEQACLAEKASFMPSVYLFGKYELYKDDLTLLEPEWAVGIGVNLPLFEGFSRGHRVAAAQNRYLAVDRLSAQARNDIDTLVEKKYNELMMEIEQYDALNASLKFAREHLRVRRLAFRSGTASSIDVVDAELALLKVEIDRFNTVYRFDVALAQLLEACGMSRSYELYQNNKDVEVLL